MKGKEKTRREYSDFNADDATQEGRDTQISINVVLSGSFAIQSTFKAKGGEKLDHGAHVRCPPTLPTTIASAPRTLVERFDIEYFSAFSAK